MTPSELVPSLVRGEDYSVLRETAGLTEGAPRSPRPRLHASVPLMSQQAQLPKLII
jgi:hypothetical protein